MKIGRKAHKLDASLPIVHALYVLSIECCEGWGDLSKVRLNKVNSLNLKFKNFRFRFKGTNPTLTIPKPTDKYI